MNVSSSSYSDCLPIVYPVLVRVAPATPRRGNGGVGDLVLQHVSAAQQQQQHCLAAAVAGLSLRFAEIDASVVGLCRLNQVDP
jgi:hypothetical protein